MRKTLFIAFCVIAMLFTFTACPEEDVLDNENNYADNDFAADLADSIYAEGAAESLVAAANQQGENVNGLTITYAFAEGMPSVPTTGEEVSTAIVVTVDITGNYTAGFHQNTHSFRSLTDGTGTVTVNGDLSNNNGILNFMAKTYTASTTDDVVIKDTDGDYEGEHTFRVTKIEGIADGNIKLENDKFKTDGMTLTLPTADKVEVYLDGKPVDYNTLCSTVGVKPGEYEITFLPDSTN